MKTRPSFTRTRVLFLIALGVAAASISGAARAQPPTPAPAGVAFGVAGPRPSVEPDAAAEPDDERGSSAAETTCDPVVFTTEQDRQNMLDQLGITKLRQGRSSSPDSPNAANYDEAKANPYPELPEALKTSSGQSVDSPETWWKQRRPEIVELLEREVYGRIPREVPGIEWELKQTREVEAGGKPAIQQELVGVVDNSSCPEIEVNISMSLTLPKEATRRVPVLMSFGWTPFDLERFNIRGFGRRGDGPRPPNKRDLLIAAGWASATLNPSTVQDDSGGWQPRRFGPGAGANAEPTGAGLTRGIIGLTNVGKPRKPDQWGALRAWGWGASRALDYLETVEEVDSGRVGIAGVSRYGKAALVAMAFDQRFALGLIASSGAGGTALYRRDFGESLENLATTGGYHWMAGNYLKYSAQESSFGRRTADDLPIDSHMTIALCAPRLTFISHGVPEKGDARWLDHRGSFMAAIAAQPVFRLLGARDLGRSDDYLKEMMPDVNVGMLDGALAWRQHDGGHTDGPNVEHFIRWAEAQWHRTPGAKVDTTGHDPAPRRNNPHHLAERSVEGGAAAKRTPIEDRTGQTIKDALRDDFLIGMAGDIPGRYSEEEMRVVREHFNAVTPENCMKPGPIHPDEETWRFERPDALVQWCVDNNKAIHGHTLVWHAQTRDWFFRDGDGAAVTRRMKDHISKLVGRYKGRIRSWDVVNEAIRDGGNPETARTENLRDSRWLQTLGPQFLTLAFRFAHEADPEAILYYNDYGIESGPKHASSLVLLRRLIEDGAPVHAVGIQGHWRTGRVPYEDIERAISNYASLGLKVSITELDLTIRGAAGGQLGRGFRGRRFGNSTPPSGEDLAAQAEAYARLFSIFQRHKDVIERVTFWGLNDRRTWRFGQHPLLFDSSNEPKPAYAAILRVLSQKAADAPDPVDDEGDAR